MKLVARLNRVNILVALFCYALTATGLYLTIEHAVLDELDESLRWRLGELYGALTRGSRTVEDIGKTGVYGSYEWVEIHRWNGPSPAAEAVYHTLLLPEPGHADEQLEYRRLTTFVRHNGELYELSITRSMIEWREVIQVLNTAVTIALALLLLLLYIAGSLTLGRTMEPLVDTVNRLDAIRTIEDLHTVFPSSGVDEFRRLADALNAMLRQMQTVFNDQKEFLQNASHELQTPLAVLRQQTESLLQDPHLTEHAIIQVAAIQETIARIGRLNSTLLLISRIENRQFVLGEHVELCALVHDVTNELDEAAGIRGLRLHCDCSVPVSVAGNRDLLRILVYNLLQNAVKFAPHHTTVAVAVTRERSTATISVTNEGAIPPERRPDLFKRFRKVASSWSDSPGLGLSIVRSICDAHGFRCELGPDADTQTTFLVHIPLPDTAP